MKQDLLTYLPPEIIIEILSRLPIRSIIRCRCVSKSWLDLINSNEFVKSHLSKSAPGLAIFPSCIYDGSLPSKPYKFLEFVENSMHPVFNMSFPHDYLQIQRSSVNGLLFLYNIIQRPRNNFLCNPITRDYIKLPRLPEYGSPSSNGKLLVDTFGFGVSKKSGQYKVVRLFLECIPIDHSEAKCEVYTLGTGSWRSINEPNVPLRYDYDDNAATFLNGNLHWRGRVLHDDSLCISCFDLETEVFTIFSAPPIHELCSSAISALEECLVVCYNSYEDERKEIVIWFMNEYGDDKSWTKKFIITKSSPTRDFVGALRPIKVFEDGDILITQGRNSSLLCYSNKTKTISEADLTELYGHGYDHVGAVSYTPSFVPLNTFTIERECNAFLNMKHCSLS
ncbi:hypothetical protein C2S51_014941 [Perilla frutescens var. frutescens]|nr:hypothetical protein C2S51_014941 [Perilla frutescens var. frutescens]